MVIRLAWLLLLFVLKLLLEDQFLGNFFLKLDSDFFTQDLFGRWNDVIQWDELWENQSVEILFEAFLGEVKLLYLVLDLGPVFLRVRFGKLKLFEHFVDLTLALFELKKVDRFWRLRLVIQESFDIFFKCWDHFQLFRFDLLSPKFMKISITFIIHDWEWWGHLHIVLLFHELFSNDVFKMMD